MSRRPSTIDALFHTRSQLVQVTAGTEGSMRLIFVRSRTEANGPFVRPGLYPASLRGSKPAHSTTGSRGYFGKRGSVFASRHSENAEPRVLPTMR